MSQNKKVVVYKQLMYAWTGERQKSHHGRV